MCVDIFIRALLNPQTRFYLVDQRYFVPTESQHFLVERALQVVWKC